MAIVLASGSPRRKELMEMLGFKDMKIIPARGEETAPKGAGPGEMVEALALGKAREVRALCKDDLIVAADTIVWFDGRVFGKPHSRDEAVSMLRSLSGREHEVYTGLVVSRPEKELCCHEVSRVYFRSLQEDEIQAYVDSGEPMDKAGAYGAQGRGAVFVRRIDGDFFNVMGLPLCRLGEMLKEQGVGLF